MQHIFRSVKGRVNNSNVLLATNKIIGLLFRPTILNEISPIVTMDLYLDPLGTKGARDIRGARRNWCSYQGVTGEDCRGSLREKT